MQNPHCVDALPGRMLQPGERMGTVKGKNGMLETHGGRDEQDDQTYPDQLQR
jgi:hypothetical protein